MTNESRLLDVFGGMERALEKQLAPKRKMLEILFSASTLARLKERGLIPTAAALLRKKRAVKHGGRKRLATEKQRFYMIGCSVDQMFSRFESAFRVSKEFKLANGNWGINTLRSELARHQFASKEIDALLQARTPMGAAKRFTAKSLTSRAHPNGISLQTVNSSYSRYLKVLGSKRTLS